MSSQNDQDFSSNNASANHQITSARIRYNLGKALARQGRLQEAIAHYRQALEWDPNLSQARQALDQLLEQQKATSDTKTVFSSNTDNNQDIPSKNSSSYPNKNDIKQGDIVEHYWNQVREYLQKGELQAATGELQNIISIKPTFEAYQNLATVLTEQEMWEDAIAAYRQAIQINPNSAEAHRGLAQALEHQENGQEAGASYRQAMALEPEAFWVGERLATLLEQQQDWQQLEAVYQEALQCHPKVARFHHLLGDMAFKLERWQEATEAYQSAIALDDTFSWSHYNLGKARIKLGNAEEAIAAFRQAKELQPDLPEIDQNLAEALSQNRNLTEALQLYRQMLSEKPNDPELNLQVANLLFRLERWEEALEAYERVNTLKDDLPWSHYNLGKATIKLGNIQEAISAFRRAQELQPDLPEIDQNLADALSQQGEDSNLTEALQLYQDALSKNPYDVALNLQVANLLFQSKRWQEAIKAYQNTLQLNSELAEAHQRLAQALEHEQQWQQAIASYRRAMALQPEVWLGERLLKLLEQQQDWEQLEAVYQQAWNNAPKIAKFHHLLGDMAFKLERWEQAKEAYQRAIELDENLPWSYYNLGKVMVKLGNLENAITAYCQAKAVEPNLPAINQNLSDALSQRQKEQNIAETWQLFQKGLIESPKGKQTNQKMNADNIEWNQQLIENTSYIKRYYQTFDWEREEQFISQTEQIYNQQPSRFDHIKATIIMPTYNRARLLSAAIKSVLSQSHKNWHLLIIDDGSTDNTESLVKNNFSHDPRIAYLKQEHLGVSAARNRGLKEADGELIFYLDSDNIWQLDYLRNMIIFLSIEELDCAYSGMELLDDNGQIKGYRGDQFLWNELLCANYIDLNVFGHRNFLKSSEQYFDTNLKRLVDWDFILRITKSKHVGYASFIGASYLDSNKIERITTSVSSNEKYIQEKHINHFKDMNNN